MPGTVVDTLEGWERMARSGDAHGVSQPASEAGGFEASSSLASARRRLATPTWLRMTLVLVATTIVVLGIVAVNATLRRHTAATAVGAEASSVLVDAGDLYVSLAEADASASTAYLHAGLEPPALRRRYTDDLQRAGERLAALSDQGLGPDARSAIAAIDSALPVYAGYVESARVNNRQEFPLGAAYLRRASDLMRSKILPAATDLYRQSALRLDRSYRAGSTPSHELSLVLVAAVAVGALVVAQVLLSWRTRRRLNVGLLAGTVAVVALGLGTLWIFDSHERALTRSQREGSDPLTVLSTVRIQALRSMGAENLDLIERGTDPAHQKEFDQVTNSIRSPDGSGLLATATRLAEGHGDRAGIDAIAAHYDDYIAAHRTVRQLHEAGSYDEAVRAAVDVEGPAATTLDRALAAEIDAARGRLEAYADDARAGLPVLALIVVLVTAAAAGLVVAGLRPRLREYR
jgi:hypothetical protein